MAGRGFLTFAASSDAREEPSPRKNAYPPQNFAHTFSRLCSSLLQDPAGLPWGFTLLLPGSSFGLGVLRYPERAVPPG